MHNVISLLFVYAIFANLGAFSIMQEAYSMQDDKEKSILTTRINSDYWTREAAKQSIQGVINVFEGAYANDAFFINHSNGSIAGQVYKQQGEVRVDFRGSQGYQELLTAFNKSSLPLQSLEIPLSGSCHKGFGFVFKSLKKSILDLLNFYESQDGISTSNRSYTFSGASAGGAYATFMGAYLKTVINPSKVRVFTYASPHFDEEGARSYNALLKDSHLNLRAQEDLITPYIDMSTEPLGTYIFFPAKGVGTYDERVSSGAYTNIMPQAKGIINMMGKIMSPLSPSSWEGHMELTGKEYLESPQGRVLFGENI